MPKDSYECDSERINKRFMMQSTWVKSMDCNKINQFLIVVVLDTDKTINIKGKTNNIHHSEKEDCMERCLVDE